MKNQPFTAEYEISKIPSYVTTLDAAHSLKAFIEEHFTGSVRFDERPVKNRQILFDKNSLAFMIKAIIKEITLRRVCEIFFDVLGDIFFIHFMTEDRAVLSDAVKAHLDAAASEFGLSLEWGTDGVSLAVPISERSILSLYEKSSKIFLTALEDAFLSDIS